MSSIRSLITLILASLLISVGGGCGGDTTEAPDDTRANEQQNGETKPAEPRGPEGGEMK